MPILDRDPLAGTAGRWEFERAEVGKWLSGNQKAVATLLIDDQRNMDVDRIARTYQDGIDALSERHWDVLYLDHDLGDYSGADGRELTGYDVVCWIMQHPEHRPGRVEIVTSNPVGRSNIEFALRRIYSR